MFTREYTLYRWRYLVVKSRRNGLRASIPTLGIVPREWDAMYSHIRTIEMASMIRYERNRTPNQCGTPRHVIMQSIILACNISCYPRPAKNLSKFTLTSSGRSSTSFQAPITSSANARPSMSNPKKIKECHICSAGCSTPDVFLLNFNLASQ